MASNTFIISDETKNSYGFVLLTDGINTEQFERNPVMFYMHEREKGIVGRWENIRKEGKQLLADAVFDDTTDLGRQVKAQVEKGFLRSASVGIDNITKETINGVETVVECDLIEVSIVDIPSNASAVKLYRKSGGCVYRLCDLDNSEPIDLRSQIVSLLGLESNATDPAIIDKLKSLIEPSDNIDNEIDSAILSGCIDESQRGNFRAMALANRSAFVSFVATQRREQEPTITRMITEAAGKGKLLFNEIGIYQNIGQRLGVSTLADLLNTLKSAVKPNDLIHRNGNRAGWTLADYRKFAPHELKDNPELYTRLIESELGSTEEPRSLEWYRKHDPEYLRKHPEEYSRLLNN